MSKNHRETGYKRETGTAVKDGALLREIAKVWPDEVFDDWALYNRAIASHRFPELKAAASLALERHYCWAARPAQEACGKWLAAVSGRTIDGVRLQAEPDSGWFRVKLVEAAAAW